MRFELLINPKTAEQMASCYPALREVADGAPLLADPHDEVAIAGAIGLVIRDPELRAALRRRGLERAREFPEERTAGRVLALLREVSECRRPGACESRRPT